MNKYLEVILLMGLALVLYLFGFWLQSVIFQFTEHLPGINWFYLPAGLRVVLVFVMGLPAAFGIGTASLLIDVYYYPEFSSSKLLLTAIASGFSPWVVLFFLRRLKAGWGPGMDGLRWSDLMTYALLYSMANAVLHQVMWAYSGDQGHIWWIDLWPMFVGDLLGAIALLSLMRLVLRAKRR